MRGLILVIASLCATTAWADTPYYVGAGWGWTDFSADGKVVDASSPTGPFNFDHKIDGTGDGINLFAGYEITRHWVVEVGYMDFGSTDSISDMSFDPLPVIGQLAPIRNASRLVFEMDGYYVDGQYHIPIGSYGSLDLLGGWFFSDGETSETRLFDNLGDIAPIEDPLDSAESSDKNGLMLGIAYTQKLTDTFYARGSFTYFDFDYGGVIEEPMRIGVDLIWDF
jgi:hypothetical protein